MQGSATLPTQSAIARFGKAVKQNNKNQKEFDQDILNTKIKYVEPVGKRIDHCRIFYKARSNRRLFFKPPGNLPQ